MAYVIHKYNSPTASIHPNRLKNSTALWAKLQETLIAAGIKFSWIMCIKELRKSWCAFARCLNPSSQKFRVASELPMFQNFILFLFFSPRLLFSVSPAFLIRPFQRGTKYLGRNHRRILVDELSVTSRMPAMHLEFLVVVAVAAQIHCPKRAHRSSLNYQSYHYYWLSSFPNWMYAPYQAPWQLFQPTCSRCLCFFGTATSPPNR